MICTKEEIMSDSNKTTQEKIKQANKNNKEIKKNIDYRLPPGQTLTEKCPILDLGITPDIDSHSWRLEIFGLVKNPLCVSYSYLKRMSQIKDISDFHCVTHWSKYDVQWGGVSAKFMLEQADMLKNSKFITLHSYDNYTTNLPIESLLYDDVLIAHELFDRPLDIKHGGPVRIAVPKKYAWKSAKWLKAIEIHEEDRSGFWELGGYHNKADPWQEERYSSDE
jgi:DMSO/TMAO reductase YedYZ molybdopterin-dependent catalytic subunit